METYLLAIQARILMYVGLVWLAAGIIWWNQDPFTVVWRASMGALIAMWVGGKLLGLVGRIVEDRLAADEAERRLAEERAEAERLEAERKAQEAEEAPSTKSKSAGRAASARR
jgi:hypothetical protein